jgi:2'-hydroxyisoflavone reductase
MKLLVLGGTVFLGRHVVLAALRAGHQVCVFNRGRRSVAWPGPVEALVGDRGAIPGGGDGEGAAEASGDLSSLAGRTFDAVIDCSGYTPAQAERMADALGPVLPHWVYVSSISACARFPPHEAYDESAPLTTDTDGYAGGKARSEEVLTRRAGAALAIVRPGLIVGPFDPTGRFAYWPARFDRGGDVLVPGRPERRVQFIDARDLAAWCLHLAAQRISGCFHAIGPPAPMADLVEACQRAAGTSSTCRYWPDEQVLAAGLEAWTELPLWLPESEPDFGGIFLGRHQKAVAAGLVTRPWADTVRDTLAWLRSEPAALAYGKPLEAAKEARMLAEARRD